MSKNKNILCTTLPALLVIDVQQAIDHYSDKERNNPNAEQVMQRLLNQWRRLKLPVIHVRHSSKFKDSPYYHQSPFYGFKANVVPNADEKIVTKLENSAFTDGSLKNHLKDIGCHEIVVCGVVTNNSVDATVRSAAALGFHVVVVSDATAAYGMTLLNGEQLTAEQVHWTFLSNLHGEYAQVCSSDQLNPQVAVQTQ